MSAFIDAQRERLGVEPICRELEGSASAYRARRRRPPSARALRDVWLTAQIRRVHAASAGIYGQFKVWDELNDEGISVARCTVERLMRTHGIAGLCNGKVARTTLAGPNPIAAPDLLRRDFTADRARPSAGGPRQKPSTNCYALFKKAVLRRPLEPGLCTVSAMR